MTLMEVKGHQRSNEVNYVLCRDLASDPLTRLFRRAIDIFDGQNNGHDGFAY